MDNTPTPRTDAVVIYHGHDDECENAINVSRQLERELAEAKAELAKAGAGDYKADYFLGELTLTGQLAEVTKQRDALAEIYPLLASAWFYGDWVAETCCERDMQKIMERQGWWPFESESDLITAMAATKGGSHE